MGWLIVETFVLMVAFVALGIAIGIAMRGLAGMAGRAEAALAGPARFAPIDAAPTRPAPPAQAPRAAAPVEAEPAPVDPERVVSVDPEIVVAEPAPDEAPAAASETIIDPEKAAAADQVGVRPRSLAGPRDHTADDLKVVKGIGPQNESRLNGLGIYHLDQIADWTPEEARWVGTYLAFPGRIEREDWIGQAERLRKG